MLDYLVEHEVDLNNFTYCSLHSPDLAYGHDLISLRALDTIKIICQRYPIKNIVFHVDKIADWSVFERYQDLPLSIENMDDLK
jgi:hypothetical protein